MIRQLIIVLLTCSILAPSVLAGTFRDDFEDGDLNGWLPDGEGMEIRVVNGELAITVKNDDSFLWFNDKQEVSDFSVSFDLKLVRALDDEPAISLSRMGANANVAVIFLFNNDMTVTNLTRLAVGPGGQPVGAGRVASEFGCMMLAEDTWYHITIAIEGGNIKVWANGSCVAQDLDWSEQPLMFGSGALVLDPDKGDFRLDNFVIVADEIGSISVEPKDKLSGKWAEIKSN